MAGEDPPRRIVSMAPNLTQIVYDIGAEDLLVGVTNFCKFPKQARSKQKVGGWLDPNYERVLSLRPDLVLTLEFNGKVATTLRRLKVPVLVQDCMTVEDVLRAYDVLGRRLGREKEAAMAKARLSARLQKVRQKARTFEPVPVLFVVDRTPGTLDQIYAVGPGNFVDDLLTWCGGRNILSDAKVSYPLVSKEVLLKRDPAVIVNALAEAQVGPDQLAQEVRVWEKLPSLRAVRDRRVHCFANEDYLIPGPTMANLAEYLSRVFEEASGKRPKK
jgi:iron complex transport system substrate-binding protein